MQHSLYGYLFMKHMSTLEDFTEVILYHHLKYSEKHKFESKYLDVELFRKANEKYQITKHLREETFEEDIIDFHDLFPFDLEDTINILKILVYTVDFRSEDTMVHMFSVASMSKEIGAYFQLPVEELEQIYLGALLHDIGKISVPIEILESPGRLTKEEFEIMKGHVISTHDILDGFVSDKIVKLACRHHERSNGSGYPYGLTKSDLTLPERIVAVADVVCALYEKRSYKGHLDKASILDIIDKMLENHEYDSDIVTVLNHHYDDIVKKVSLATKEKSKSTKI